MTKKSNYFAFITGLALLVSSGCAASRNLDTRTPPEVFLDVVSGIFEESDLERVNRESREVLEKRQQWQCDNLSQAELTELGVSK